MRTYALMITTVAMLFGCAEQQSGTTATPTALNPTVCGGPDTGCKIGDRSYAARTPDGWNGTDPLPVLIHFHGWGRQGRTPIRSPRVFGATNDTGVLLLAPDGLRKSWAFWQREDRDIRFTEAVLADAERRWPIDRSKVYLSGYSFGSLMALAVACDSGDKYAGVLGIGGLLDYARPSRCDTGPVTIRNVHGLRDTVIDLPTRGEDDPAIAMLPWVQIGGCDPEQRTATKVSAPAPIREYTEHRWTDCQNGKEVQIDIHGRGHFIPKGWIKRQLEDLLARS